MRRALVFALALACLTAATPVSALGPVAFGPSLSGAGWKDMTFRGRKPVEFSAQGTSTLRIQSESGVSLIWRPLPPEFAPGGKAAWRWRVDQPVPATDLSDKGADDRDVAVYFFFGNEGASPDNPPTSLRAAMLKGRALVYVWGGDAAAGSVIKSPSMRGRGQLVVKRPSGSAAGEWQSESVDLRADFRKAFGREPGPLMGVGISADSDNTGTTGDATVSDLVIR